MVHDGPKPNLELVRDQQEIRGLKVAKSEMFLEKPN